MSQIIYQSPRRNEEYLIDEDTQQLLSYLYLYGSTHPNELVGHLNYKNKEEIIELINDALCKNKADLVKLRYTNQLTLDNN